MTDSTGSANDSKWSPSSHAAYTEKTLAEPMEPRDTDIETRLRASVVQARALDRSALLTEAAQEIAMLRREVGLLERANKVLSALLDAQRGNVAHPGGVAVSRGENYTHAPVAGNSGDTRDAPPTFYH